MHSPIQLSSLPTKFQDFHHRQIIIGFTQLLYLYVIMIHVPNNYDLFFNCYEKESNTSYYISTCTCTCVCHRFKHWILSAVTYHSWGFFFYYWVCISCDVLENLSPGQDACMKDYPIETVNFKCLDIKQQGIYEIKSLRY